MLVNILWVWIFFFAVVLTALAVDLGIANRKIPHARRAVKLLTWVRFWISLQFFF